jgi:hypothetical protein
MKISFRLFLIVFVILLPLQLFAQAGQWTWLKGLNGIGSFGNYGIQGVSSPANDPPGVYEPCEWTDLNGNFWFYGGSDQGYGERSDLWKYDPLTNEWTWMSGPGTTFYQGVFGSKGVSSPSNHPPSILCAASWVDHSGNLWLYGGFTTGPSSNDLWKYDIGLNEWTWMKGDQNNNLPPVYGIQGVPDTANTPGELWETAATWTDSAGDFWLFGGLPENNNLWKYNIATNSWTWIKGNISLVNGVFGTMGVEDSTNIPPIGYYYCHWKDSIGNLWVFGGEEEVNSILDDSNNLWRYNIATNNWTWMNGNYSNRYGIYRSRCDSSLNRLPRTRMENRTCWTDLNGDFWMFGGETDSGNALNDLWKYCLNSNKWIWVSGDSTSNSSDNWGTSGVSSTTNMPGGRIGSIGFSDQNNNLFLFGGSIQNTDRMNSVWKFTIDTTCLPCVQVVNLPHADFSLSDSSICPGGCISFSNLSQYANSYQWYFPGGTPTSDTTMNPQNICYYTSGNFDVSLISVNASGTDTMTFPGVIQVYPPIQFSSITQNGDTLFSLPGFFQYQWYDDSTLIQGANNYFYVATHDGTYSVIVFDTNGCQALATIINVVTVTDRIQSNDKPVYCFYDSENLLINFSSMPKSKLTLKLTDISGRLIYSDGMNINPDNNSFSIRLALTKGVYLISVLGKEFDYSTKVIVY